MSKVAVTENMSPINLNKLAEQIHASNSLQWALDSTGEPIKPSKNELMALMATRLLDARRGAQYGKPDNRLPNRTIEECQLADCLIRILDYCGGFDIDLNGAFWEKLEYNKTLKEGELVWCTGNLND
jgi:hypothetical protein